LPLTCCSVIIAGAGKSHTLIDESVALLSAYQEMQPYSGTAAYPRSPISPITEGLTELDWRKKNRRMQIPLARRTGDDVLMTELNRPGLIGGSNS
jgi:hypothetical protein